MKIMSCCYAALVCTSVLFSYAAYAAPTVGGETFVYNAHKFQQVCKSRSVGDAVSMALNGVIFNGTCEVMLVPNDRRAWGSVDDSALTQACQGQSGTINATLNAQEVKGQCAHSFQTIEPVGKSTTDSQ